MITPQKVDPKYDDNEARQKLFGKDKTGKSTIDGWITKSDRVTFDRYEIDLTCIDGKLALSDFIEG